MAYLVSFPKYFISNNGVILNYGLGSFKVIANGAFRKLWYGFLFAFHYNYGRIFSRFDTIHERDRQADTAASHRMTA